MKENIANELINAISKIKMEILQKEKELQDLIDDYQKQNGIELIDIEESE